MFLKLLVYNIQRDKLTISKLKERTEKVLWFTDILIDDEYPF